MEPICSLSVDSWGVDYVLLPREDVSPALLYHYRNPRTEAVYAATTMGTSADAIFAETGIQFMPINTLYQFLAHYENEQETLAKAERFLLIADFFHYLFCEIGVAERSLASTTQIYNPNVGAWSEALQDRFDLPASFFPP